MSCSSLVLGQAYTTAAGVRLGKYIGLSVSQRVLPKMTVEGMYQTTLGGQQQYLTALAKRHHSLIARRLNFYYGGGAHLGWEGGSNVDNTGTKTSFTGVDGILGAELTIARFNISIDYKPAINIGNDNWFDNQGGITVRYVLIKSNSPQAQKRQKARKYKNKEKEKAKKYRKRSLNRANRN